MEALIVYPEDKEQITAVKAIMKAMKIPFETRKHDMPGYVITGIKKSLEQVKNGESFPYTGIRDMLKQIPTHWFSLRLKHIDKEGLQLPSLNTNYRPSFVWVLYYPVGLLLSGWGRLQQSRACLYSLSLCP
jgi:hypothetical protein